MSELTATEKAHCLWRICLVLATAMVAGGCSSPPPPQPPVKMKCLAVYAMYRSPNFAVMEDEGGNRFHVEWYQRNLPVIGDTWLVQEGTLIERVKEPE